VRVLEVIEPGNREPEPSHRRLTWRDPEGPHSVENIHTTRYHAFRVEILD
jgi:hypothetical protein